MIIESPFFNIMHMYYYDIIILILYIVYIYSIYFNFFIFMVEFLKYTGVVKS